MSVSADPPVAVVASLAVATLLAGVVTLLSHSDSTTTRAATTPVPPAATLSPAARSACAAVLRFDAVAQRDLARSLVDGRPRTTREAVFELLSKDAAALDGSSLEVAGSLRDAVSTAALAVEGVAIDVDKRGVADPADLRAFQQGSADAATLCAGG